MIEGVLRAERGEVEGRTEIGRRRGGNGSYPWREVVLDRVWAHKLFWERGSNPDPDSNPEQGFFHRLSRKEIVEDG